MLSDDNKAIGFSNDKDHGYNVYLFVKDGDDTVLRISACQDYATADNAKKMQHFEFDSFCSDNAIDFYDACQICDKWHCPECGFIEGNKVTFEERCEKCGRKVS